MAELSISSRSWTAPASVFKKRSRTPDAMMQRKGANKWSAARRLASLIFILLMTVLYLMHLSQREQSSFSFWPAMRSRDLWNGIGDIADVKDVASLINTFNLSSGFVSNVTLVASETQQTPVLYLIYYPLYGQLNNQLQSLFNSLVLAKLLNAVLVVPRIGVGFDSRFSSTPGGFRSYILGDYFEWDRVAKVQSIMKMDDFLNEDATQQLVKDQNFILSPTFNSRNLSREKEFYPYAEFFKPFQRTKDDTEQLKSEISTELQQGARKTRKCQSWYELLLASARRDEPVNSPLYLMSCMYTTINDEWDCLGDVPYWMELRRHLVPRTELRRSVADFVDTLQRPILSLHMRLLRGNEVILAETLTRILQDTVDQDLEKVRTIYIAYGNKELEYIQKAGAIEHLKSSFPSMEVVTCADMANCVALGDDQMTIPKISPWADELQRNDVDKFNGIFRSHYSGAILDMWMLANADIFVGRSASTLSQNVNYWRYAFNTTSAPLFTYYYRGFQGAT